LKLDIQQGGVRTTWVRIGVWGAFGSLPLRRPENKALQRGEFPVSLLQQITVQDA
jgi:hypothetical protein